MCKRTIFKQKYRKSFFHVRNLSKLVNHGPKLADFARRSMSMRFQVFEHFASFESFSGFEYLSCFEHLSCFELMPT